MRPRAFEDAIPAVCTLQSQWHDAFQLNASPNLAEQPR